MGRGDKQPCDEVLVARLHSRTALAAASLRAIGGERNPFDIAKMRHGNDHVFALNEILVLDARGFGENDGPARGGMGGFHRDQLVLDDRKQPRARTQDGETVGDLDPELIQSLGDFVAAKRGQALQPEFENGLRLGFRKLAVAILGEHMTRVRDQGDQWRHVARGPGAPHQGHTGGGRVRRSTDQTDECVNVGECNGKANLHMRGVARLGEEVLGAPCDDLFAKIDEGRQKILERQDFRTAAIQGDHVASETRLQRGEAPELI